MGLGSHFKLVINFGNLKCEFGGLFLLLLNFQCTKSLFNICAKKKKSKMYSKKKVQELCFNLHLPRRGESNFLCDQEKYNFSLVERGLCQYYIQCLSFWG